MTQIISQKSNGTFWVVALLIATLFLLPAGVVKAQTDALKSAIQNATDSVNKAKEAEDPLAHKQALQKIIDSSIIRTNEFIGRLTLLRGLAPGYEELRDAHAASLRSFVQHYNAVLSKLGELEDVDSIKALAAELKDWRDSIVTPEMEKIVEFLLVFQGRSILNTANNRLRLIEDDVQYLQEVKEFNIARVRALLNDAAELLKSADRLQLLAEEVLLAQADPEPAQVIQSPTIRTIVSSSLIKVKSAYKNFLEISGVVRAAINK
ncbi:MAG: Uncharacterized protein G01um10143_47 [Parcubacteria group bacterium Gr01-1014_3]|nr:MAG: Uncharacterized protein G01um10143_47 [Parcubacteria group bacterium Gr01-1014_3]